MDLIYRFVKNVVDTRYEDLPLETVEVTKRCVIDTLACLIAGSGAPGCKAVVEYAKGDGGTQENRVAVFVVQVVVVACIYILDLNRHEGGCWVIGSLFEGLPALWRFLAKSYTSPKRQHACKQKG